MANVVDFHSLLFAIKQVLHEIDRNCTVIRQVEFALYCQKAMVRSKELCVVNLLEDLLLPLELCAEC